MDSGQKDQTSTLSGQRSQKDGEAFKTKWKIRGSDKSAHLLRKLFSIFIKEIVEGMIGYVRLPTVMMKLLSDNGAQEFGDFKATILGMLGTYDFERRILVSLDFLYKSSLLGALCPCLSCINIFRVLIKFILKLLLHHFTVKELL